MTPFTRSWLPRFITWSSLGVVVSSLERKWFVQFIIAIVQYVPLALTRFVRKRIYAGYFPAFR